MSTTRTLVFLLSLGSTLSLPPRAAAEPHLAYRGGYKCSTCHVNQTGGGKRTSFGQMYAQTDLRPLWAGGTAKSEGFSSQLGPSISIGADFVAVHRTSFAVAERGTPAGSAPTSFSQDAQNTFDITNGQLYFEVTLAPELLTLYLDEIVSPAGAQSREAFLLWRQLPLEGYLKFGRMLLPFGIRVWDDETLTRQVTGFNFDNQDLGIELGLEPGNLSFSLALSNGTQGARDDNPAKALSSVASVYLGRVVLGASAAINKAQGTRRLTLGPFAAVHLGPLTLMGEADWLRDRGDTEQEQLVAYSSADMWIRGGLNLRLRYDYHDPYYRFQAPGTAKAEAIDEDERSRLTLGAEALLTPNLSTSLHYHRLQSVPQDLHGNSDRAVAALHAFF